MKDRIKTYEDDIIQVMLWGLGIGLILAVVVFYGLTRMTSQINAESAQKQPAWLTSLDAPAVDVDKAVASGGLTVSGQVNKSSGLFPNGVPVGGVNQTNEVGLGGLGNTVQLVGSTDQSGVFTPNFRDNTSLTVWSSGTPSY
jgi:hypothetical protein